MYPKVFLDYMGRHRTYGPVRVLPHSKLSFMACSQVRRSPLKLIRVKLLKSYCKPVGETNEEGDARVFFELNGQPRVIRVPDRKVKSTAAARPKAENGNINHIGAPMPGVVASVAVLTGAQVRAGDLLLTIEAMKMETWPARRVRRGHQSRACHTRRTD
jgi:pyruvate carboxylase